ncbi:TetR/AcrR family transcriptional regulator [Dongia soli]|uniref:TetR/AcrR family transcriptional regulator n=1 Tax=Dongia soli TaxID=600628 RepID=A0ABU5EF38_9PROT|nr:TetR/AcrR family transcriptional regulator [Dongia soli]MDY0884542.1 TetR/AcrR family transcriptional regulator [Dongia soli]
MIVLQNKKVIKRGRGRPPARSEEENRRLVVQAAAQEFQANGYANTCIDKIAARAGVSTRTIYQLVSNKAELFGAFIADRAGSFILTVDEAQLDQLPLVEALTRILTNYGKLTLAPETIAIMRLVTAESGRFPEIGRAFYDQAVTKINDVMEAWLVHHQERGAIKLDNPRAAVGMLRGMMLMDPQRDILLGQQDIPTEAEIERRARACATLFLNGCLA